MKRKVLLDATPTKGYGPSSFKRSANKGSPVKESPVRRIDCLVHVAERTIRASNALLGRGVTPKSVVYFNLPPEGDVAAVTASTASTRASPALRVGVDGATPLLHCFPIPSELTFEEWEEHPWDKQEFIANHFSRTVPVFEETYLAEKKKAVLAERCKVSIMVARVSMYGRKKAEELEHEEQRRESVKATRIALFGTEKAEELAQKEGLPGLRWRGGRRLRRRR